MSHQTNFYIPAANSAEFFILRATLRELGYPIFHQFANADPKDLSKNWSMNFKGARLAHDGVARAGEALYADNTVTLAEFVEKQFVPVKTPAQLELEKLEASAEALNKQIAALKASL
ncbi:hypothetical protein phiK7A1_136 [Pseudomonas phage phiK7A1]|uniref:Uncharacterized protein n=1 Tax=Pseudomonas phage phiK7A1 TaxID=2759194 RepID=A0A7H0XFY4_9CAUD|nr:hypothetical protein phiK7A1_136 [Pseudomonas phage phiK7A1]